MYCYYEWDFFSPPSLLGIFIAPHLGAGVPKTLTDLRVY
jgi:hypothetical protein